MKILVVFPDGRIIDDQNPAEPFSGSLDGNILYKWDVITKNEVDDLIQERGQPKYIITDSMTHFEFKDFYTVEFWTESQIRQFEKDKIDIPTVSCTTSCANFTINKKSNNRHMILKLSEIFNIDVSYTWSGIDDTFDMSFFINEHNIVDDPQINSVWPKLLEPITRFKKQWIATPANKDAGYGITYTSNTSNWNHGLKDLVSSTAVSLIGESIYDNTDAITFDEKTVFSVYGLTMPIWVGGKHQATNWKKRGFDTFDDVIDHSYESMPTLLERCFYAVYLNKQILTDLKYATKVRNSVMDRLIANRDKLTYQQFHNFNKNQVNSWPEEIKDIAYPLFNKYAQFKF